MDKLTLELVKELEMYHSGKAQNSIIIKKEWTTFMNNWLRDKILMQV